MGTSLIKDLDIDDDYYLSRMANRSSDVDYLEKPDHIKEQVEDSASRSPMRDEESSKDIADSL